MSRVWIGIGFGTAATPDALTAAVRAALDELPESPAGLATLEHKTHALAPVAGEFGIAVRGFGAAELAAVSTGSASARVAAAVGTPSVAEAAAILASGCGRLVLPARIHGGIVVAAAVE